MRETVRVRVRRSDIEVEAEGPTEFVRPEIEYWFGTVPSAEDERPTQPESPSGGPVPASRRTGTMRLKEFVALKAPHSVLETAAVVAAWAKENEGIDVFGQADMDRLFKLAEEKRPADILNTMALAASRKGWFEHAAPGKYRLTAGGEDMVALDLGKPKT